MSANNTPVRSVDCYKCGNSYAHGRVLYHLRDEESVDLHEVNQYADLHGLQRLSVVVDVPDVSDNNDEEECDHPNGFGAHGCPCGATVPPADDEPLTGSTPVLVPQEVIDAIEVQQAEARTAAAFLGANDLLAENTAVSMELLLTEWWLKRAEAEARAVVPKAIEYGSNSLMQLGYMMARLQGRTVDDSEALELGCWVNAVQKIERWTDAVLRGERTSDDSIYDLGIYVKMAQRIRDVGHWPGV